MLNALADMPAQRQQLSYFHDGREPEHFHDGNLAHRVARIHQENPGRCLEISPDRAVTAYRGVGPKGLGSLAQALAWVASNNALGLKDR